MTNGTVAEVIRGWGAEEIWRPLPEAPAYSVSSFGRVSGPRTSELAFGYTHGYKLVSISVGGVVKTRRVHVLVAQVFLGPAPFAGAIVAHNDGDKENCRVDNLRWASARENQHDAIRHSRRPRGSKVYGAKLKEEQIAQIRARLESGESYPRIAGDYSVSVSTIYLIRHRKIWRGAGGAAWNSQQA